LLLSIGISWQRQKKYQKALRFYEQALALFLTTYDEDSEVVKNCRSWIESVKKEMGGGGTT
jgi:hypothetical protein